MNYQEIIAAIQKAKEYKPEPQQVPTEGFTSFNRLYSDLDNLDINPFSVGRKEE